MRRQASEYAALCATRSPDRTQGLVLNSKVHFRLTSAPMPSILEGDHLAFTDRRRYQRLEPSPPVLVSWDNSKYSLLLDLCEGGLALRGCAAGASDGRIPLEFEVPGSSECIHVQAEVVWTSDAGNRTGFRFLDLRDDFREMVKAWVSNTSVPMVTAENSRPAGVTEALTDAIESPVLPEPRWPLEQSVKFNSSGSWLHLASIVVMTAVISSTAAFLLGYYWRGRELKRQVKSIMTAARSSGYAADGPAISSPKSPVQATFPSVLPLNTPGFVLQVGAMEQEANADALSNLLREKNFSAYVFRRSADNFYRVAVGPYATEVTATQIQHDLEREGYKSILRPWSPE